jgi:hypothetical protein
MMLHFGAAATAVSVAGLTMFRTGSHTNQNDTSKDQRTEVSGFHGAKGRHRCLVEGFLSNRFLTNRAAENKIPQPLHKKFCEFAWI